MADPNVRPWPRHHSAMTPVNPGVTEDTEMTTETEPVRPALPPFAAVAAEEQEAIAAAVASFGAAHREYRCDAPACVRVVMSDLTRSDIAQATASVAAAAQAAVATATARVVSHTLCLGVSFWADSGSVAGDAVFKITIEIVTPAMTQAEAEQRPAWVAWQRAHKAWEAAQYLERQDRERQEEKARRKREQQEHRRLYRDLPVVPASIADDYGNGMTREDVFGTGAPVARLRNYTPIYIRCEDVRAEVLALIAEVTNG